ncbi:MAG: hypothetical protein COA63_001385 [Methylophaga sp.]|nr:hypothetical protein [Methylophaga sp.]
MKTETRGYKPHLVRDILGLSKERFRYWRNKLDPKPHRSYFTYSDILAYRIMKTLIEDKREPVEFLSRFDWSELFKFLTVTSTQDLRIMVVALHVESNSMTIHSLEDIANNKSNKVIFVYFEELIEEQFSAFVQLGSPHNIVPITQTLKA